MILLPSAVSFSLLFIYALAIGSLLNVVIYRLPAMLKAEWEKECRCLLDLPVKPIEKLNLFWPRSHCPKCKITVRAIDNIPVLSYLWLKGRCRGCKTAISIQYPLIELTTALLSILAAWILGFNLTLIFACLFIWIIIPITVIDLREQLIPDSLSYSLLWLGLVANSYSLFTSLDVAVYSAIAGWVLLWGFIKIFYLLTGKVGMGHGDFKLFAAFGAWFGWTMLPLILFLSSLIGAIVGIVYLRCTAQSSQTPIPFGPYLCLAGLISLFWGEPIIQAYLSLYP